MVVLLEDALSARTEVVHVFAEITIVFEYFVEPQQAVDLVLLLQQLLLKQFYVGLNDLSLLTNGAQSESGHALGCQIVRTDPQRRNPTKVHQTHVYETEAEVTSVDLRRTRLLVFCLLVLSRRNGSLLTQVHNALKG